MKAISLHSVETNEKDHTPSGMEKFWYKVNGVRFWGYRHIVKAFVPKRHSHARENARRRRQIESGMLHLTDRP